MKLHFESVNLKELIDTCTQVVSPLLSTNPKVSLSINFNSKKLPQKFLGDSLRLRQVLINLLSNAIKFTEQGTISVKVSLEQNISHIPWLFQKKSPRMDVHADGNLETDNVQLHRRSGSFERILKLDSPKSSLSNKQPLFLVFSVADSGIGIDTQTTKLFDAFEQGDSSTTKKYGGSGLGLGTRLFFFFLF